MNNTLEKHRFFPYVAWTLIIGFVIFTYSLTIRLSNHTLQASENTDRTANALENGVGTDVLGE